VSAVDGVLEALNIDACTIDIESVAEWRRHNRETRQTTQNATKTGDNVVYLLFRRCWWRVPNAAHQTRNLYYFIRVKQQHRQHRPLARTTDGHAHAVCVKLDWAE